MKSRKRPSSGKRTRKKRYQSPKLSVYGSLRHLTQVKMGGNNDGGGRPMTRMSAGPPV